MQIKNSFPTLSLVLQGVLHMNTTLFPGIVLYPVSFDVALSSASTFLILRVTHLQHGCRRRRVGAFPRLISAGVHRTLLYSELRGLCNDPGAAPSADFESRFL